MSSEILIQSFPYFVLLVLIIFFFRKTNDQRALLLSITLMTLFSAIRYDIGWDYWNYRNVIENNIGNDSIRFELLEKSLVLLCQKLNFPQLFFIVNSFLTYIFLYLGIKKLSKCYFYSFLTFLALPIFFFSSLSVVRFALAATIIFWGYSFLSERKFIRYVLIVLFAFLIHKSSLIAIILIPMYLFPLNRNVNIIIFIISLFISSTQILPIIKNSTLFYKTLILIDEFEYVNYYLEGTGKIGGFNKIPLLFIAINAINLIYYNNLLKSQNNIKGNDTKIYITFFNIGCCFMLIFKDITVLSSRISVYFLYAIILIIPLYFNIKEYRFNMLTKQAIFLIYIILFSIQLYIPNYNGHDSQRYSTYYPYKTFLNK